MLTSDERKQIANFQEAVASVIDIYLKEGMDPDNVRMVLQSEATSDLATRRAELETA